MDCVTCSYARLVVEDEARLLKRGLEEEGYAVDVGADSPEGLWLATENSYAANVLDVMLPGSGADDDLVKPFSLLELGARLRALARRDDRAGPAVLGVGDLRLDPAAKRA